MSPLVYANNSILFVTDTGATCSGIPIAKDTFYTVKHCVSDEATRVIVFILTDENNLTRYTSKFERIVNPERESKGDYPLKIKIKYDVFTDEIFPVDGNARARRYEVHCTYLDSLNRASRAKIVVEDVNFDDDGITSEASAIISGCSGGGLFAMTVDGPVLVALVSQLAYSRFSISLETPLIVYNEAIYEELEGDENDLTDYGGKR